MGRHSPETTAWLQRMQGDGEQGLVKMFEHYRSRLREVVRLRLGDQLMARIDPSDVLQEAYLDARRQMDRYLKAPQVGAYGWLRRLVIDRLKKLQRQHLGAERRAVGREFRLPANSSASFARQLLAQSSPSQRLIQSEMKRVVQQAIAQLDEDDREIILMRDFEGMSNNEVADSLGLTVSAATMRHGRALFRLKEILVANMTSE